MYINDIVPQLLFSVHRLMALCADEISLVAPPVTELQRLLTLGETELKWLDMNIIVKKYCCIGP